VVVGASEVEDETAGGCSAVLRRLRASVSAPPPQHPISDIKTRLSSIQLCRGQHPGQCRNARHGSHPNKSPHPVHSVLGTFGLVRSASVGSQIRSALCTVVPVHEGGGAPGALCCTQSLLLDCRSGRHVPKTQIPCRRDRCLDIRCAVGSCDRLHMACSRTF
jgi:hypothetical protein